MSKEMVLSNVVEVTRVTATMETENETYKVEFEKSEKKVVSTINGTIYSKEGEYLASYSQSVDGSFNCSFQNPMKMMEYLPNALKSIELAKKNAEGK